MKQANDDAYKFKKDYCSIFLILLESLETLFFVKNIKLEFIKTNKILIQEFRFPNLKFQNKIYVIKYIFYKKFNSKIYVLVYFN